MGYIRKIALFYCLDKLFGSNKYPAAQVESLRVGGAKPLHAPAQVCSIGSKQQVIVHQNVGKYVDLKAFTHLSHSV